MTDETDEKIVEALAEALQQCPHDLGATLVPWSMVSEERKRFYRHDAKHQLAALRAAGFEITGGEELAELRRKAKKADRLAEAARMARTEMGHLGGPAIGSSPADDLSAAIASYDDAYDKAGDGGKE